jgi:hypothetical protein
MNELWDVSEEETGWRRYAHRRQPVCLTDSTTTVQSTRFFRRRTVFRLWRRLSRRFTLLHLLLLSGVLLLKLLRLLRVALFHRLFLGVVKVFLRGLHRWTSTQCLKCGGWSPHSLWYAG